MKRDAWALVGAARPRYHLDPMRPEGPGFQSTHPTAPASGWSGPDLRLTLVHPRELSGQVIPLRNDLVLGRSPEAGVTSIFHGTISRRHAAVRTGLGGMLCLHDLGSRNGTKVNGKPLDLPTPLGPGTVVRLGDVLAVVDEASESTFDADLVLPGQSVRMARTRELLARAAPDSAAVLIIGETGTGKERLAHEVHRLSQRPGHFLALNCAELSPQLIESQLFGHEKGAFTGAAGAKVGLFAAAHGGTLFLDEIGELALDLQPKLLRVLQEGEVRPLGSVQARKVDVRIVAATNRDLPELVGQGTFRRDLLARLSLWELRLPPLRERRQDMLHWVDRLCTAWNHERNTDFSLEFLPDAAEKVLLDPWLDNLRGLSRMVHRLASADLRRPAGVRALCDAMPELFVHTSPSEEGVQPRIGGNEFASVEAPPQNWSTRPPGPDTFEDATGAAANPRSPSKNERRPSREDFLAVYTATGFSVRATSKHYDRDRRQIYRWLESFGIPRDRERD